jgi:hypothetical protein
LNPNKKYQLKLDEQQLLEGRKKVSDNESQKITRLRIPQLFEMLPGNQ